MRMVIGVIWKSCRQAIRVLIPIILTWGFLSRLLSNIMMMTVGADLYTTCKLMGHADVRTVDSKKIEAVDMVDKMFEQEEAKD